MCRRSACLGKDRIAAATTDQGQLKFTKFLDRLFGRGGKLLNSIQFKLIEIHLVPPSLGDVDESGKNRVAAATTDQGQLEFTKFLDRLFGRGGKLFNGIQFKLIEVHLAPRLSDLDELGKNRVTAATTNKCQLKVVEIADKSFRRLFGNFFDSSDFLLGTIHLHVSLRLG